MDNHNRMCLNIYKKVKDFVLKNKIKLNKHGNNAKWVYGMG